MSWLFSRALVAEYSAATSSAGAPSVPLNVMHTQHKFWRNDKPMAHSRLSQFGLTCAALTEDYGEALLTWFREDSLVKTSRQLDPDKESADIALGSGLKWQELSVRYDLGTSTWRTHQCLWDEALPWSSVILPTWGIAHAGELSEQLISEPPISVIASGLLPSKRWPTPVASMSKGSSPAALTRKSGADRTNDRLDHAVMALHGGQLNPEWVEWLMGWPIGWTELKPLAMDKFHLWQQQHSRSYQDLIGEAA